MAVNNINVTRGGREWISTIGITPEGDTRLSSESTTPDPTTGQNARRYPVEFKVTFNEGEGNGSTARMEVIWKEVLLDNLGNPIYETAKSRQMVTVPNEMKEFIFGMAAPILRSMLNGDFRANLGFNHLPVYDLAGNVIAYTEEQENEPPTWDYYAQPTPPEPTE